MNKSLSVYLDLARFIASMLVFFYHARFKRFDGAWLEGVGQYGHDAVMVFFVLSGFVIAHVTISRTTTLSSFTVSRLSRLYSVVIPALIATILLDSLGREIRPELYLHKDYEYSEPLLRFFANLFFVNELWFQSWLAFSNSPFWSLCYEFWYYTIYASIFYFYGVRRILIVTLVLLIAGPKILLLFPVWLAGVYVYKFKDRIYLTKLQAYAIALLPLIIYVLYKKADIDVFLLEITVGHFGQDFVYEQMRWSRRFLHDYIIAVLFSAHLIGVISLSRYISINKWFANSISHMAGMTFALYLFHFPLLQFFAVFDDNGIKIVIMTFCSIYLVAFITERRKKEWRLVIEKLFSLCKLSFTSVKHS